MVFAKVKGTEEVSLTIGRFTAAEMASHGSSGFRAGRQRCTYSSAVRSARCPSLAGHPPPRSKRLEGGLLFLLNVEKLIQLGDLEHLVNLGVDVAEDQPSAHGLKLLV